MLPTGFITATIIVVSTHLLLLSLFLLLYMVAGTNVMYCVSIVQTGSKTYLPSGGTPQQVAQAADDMQVLTSSVARLEGRMGKLEAVVEKKMDAILTMIQEQQVQHQRREDNAEGGREGPRPSASPEP